MNHPLTPPPCDPPRCCRCGEPILVGQPRWAGDPEQRPWHYGCADAEGLTMRAGTRGGPLPGWR